LLSHEKCWEIKAFSLGELAVMNTFPFVSLHTSETTGVMQNVSFAFRQRINVAIFSPTSET
jgi:hypothetical protein